MAEYGICSQTLIPIRSKAAESAEMVSQILFGELYTVLEKQERWLKIRTEWDDYEGWIDRKTDEGIAFDDFERYKRDESSITLKTIDFKFFAASKSSVPIVAGSFLYKNDVSHKTELKKCGNTVVKYALHFINAPYLWGGRTVLGIDCSGLTQIVFKLLGVRIPRDASQQVKVGEIVESVEDAQPGDLAFFDNKEGKITHVGIIMENGRVIHASGRVRVDEIDNKGIFSKDFNKYTHSLKVIRRVI